MARLTLDDSIMIRGPLRCARFEVSIRLVEVTLSERPLHDPG
jgi:hypothetical protein